jgi:hypothetical protein
MFAWFGPRCPLATGEKAWVEWRMRWLADRFGLDRLRTARVVLPTEEFFPARLAGDQAGARECLDRMCGYMGVDPTAVTLEVVADDDMPGAAGLYQMRTRSAICVAESQLTSPPQLLATLAHELAHEILLKGGYLTQATADHEQVTDLLPVILGTGIFVANATVQFASSFSGGWSYWNMSRQGYLNSIALGYALALFAFARGEDSPDWAAHLRTDAAITLRAGLNYVSKTGDTLFHPDTAGGSRPPAAADVTDRLTHRSPSVRIGALWDIGEYGLPPADLLEAVAARIGDRDPDVRRAAAHTLGTFGVAAAGFVPRLIDAVRHGRPAVQAAAAGALGEIGADPETTVPVLAGAVADPSAMVSCAAAAAVARYGPAAAPAAPAVLAALEAWALEQDGRLPHLVAALRAISQDPAGRVKEHFAGTDGEIRRLILGVLRDQGG